MYDLIYADKKAEGLVRKEFPDAKIEDASDFIHTERFSVEMEGDISDEYLEFMLKTGLFRWSLNMSLSLTDMDKEKKDRIMKIVNKIKTEKQKHD